MKIKSMAALILAGSFAVLMGCSTPSVITLKDGRQIETVDTPKLDADAGFYQYKQLDGKEATINKDEVFTIKAL